MAISTTESVTAKNKEHVQNEWSKEWLDTGLVKIYIESNGDELPLPVCLNGKTVFVPVGEYVEIPCCIADIIRQSRRMVEESKKQSKEYLDGKKKLN